MGYDGFYCVVEGFTACEIMYIMLPKLSSYCTFSVFVLCVLIYFCINCLKILNHWSFYEPEQHSESFSFWTILVFQHYTFIKSLLLEL